MACLTLPYVPLALWQASFLIDGMDRGHPFYPLRQEFFLLLQFYSQGLFQFNQGRWAVQTQGGSQPRFKHIGTKRSAIKDRGRGQHDLDPTGGKRRAVRRGCRIGDDNFTLQIGRHVPLDEKTIPGDDVSPTKPALKLR